MLSHHTTAPDLGDSFLRAAEAAHEIGSPQQFFLWLRLHLCRFIPHDLVLTRVNHGERGGWRAQVLNCVALPGTLLDELGNPSARLWRGLAEAWDRDNQQALALSLRQPPWAQLAGATGLAAAGFDQVLLHGQRWSPRADDEVLVAFLQRDTVDAPRAASALAALALWMPYLRFALWRCHGGPLPPPRPQAGDGARPLTARELQVLTAVRDAKANAQIAVLLGISPLTVKNHLRSIQRKLGARNRAHAVAEAMSQRLIS